MGTGGWTPYTWQFLVPSYAPPGLTLDAHDGTLFGTPSKAGTYVFQILLGDYSGPTFYYLTDALTIEIGG